MNDEIIVNKMVDFIFEKEREFQATKFAQTSKSKNDVVKAILVELERVQADED